MTEKLAQLAERIEDLLEAFDLEEDDTIADLLEALTEHGGDSDDGQEDGK